MIKRTVTLEEVVALLNGCCKLDRDAMHRLVEARVECNEALADHPSVQVGDSWEKGKLTVGILGILNGIFGLDDEGWGAIAANYVPNLNGKVDGFLILKENTNGKERESWPNYPTPFPKPEGK